MFLHVCFTCGIVLVAAQTIITQLSPGGLPGKGAQSTISHLWVVISRRASLYLNEGMHDPF